MDNWRRRLRLDPIPALLAAEDEALEYFARRDLGEEDVEPICHLWSLTGARKILRKQQPDGAWDRSGGRKKHEAVNYRLIETWKQFRFLVDVYGFTREDPSAARAAEYLFSCQTEEGDIRGMLANQVAAYYTGAILSLLIKVGYEDDPRIEMGFRWLLSRRQEDLGWSEALITRDLDRETLYRLTSQVEEPVDLNRSRPFSHNSTGMVLRAFAAHSMYRRSEAARTAAGLLKSRFFQPDRNTSYQAASYWVKFQYPFWWNNLVAALDSVSLIDPSRDEKMEEALRWLTDHQAEDGLWNASYVEARDAARPSDRETRLWVSLAICRVLRRVMSGDSQAQGQ
ncbi:MAG: hypothetical protein MUF84_13800 [Anaerolineae bacterium]|nr:hypothetical protein [Anaerolineae bacterium]